MRTAGRKWCKLSSPRGFGINVHFAWETQLIPAYKTLFCFYKLSQGVAFLTRAGQCGFCQLIVLLGIQCSKVCSNLGAKTKTQTSIFEPTFVGKFRFQCTELVHKSVHTWKQVQIHVCCHGFRPNLAALWSSGAWRELAKGPQNDKKVGFGKFCFLPIENEKGSTNRILCESAIHNSHQYLTF